MAEMERAADALEYPRPEDWREAGVEFAADAPTAETHGPQITFRRFEDGRLTYVYRWNRWASVWERTFANPVRRSRVGR